MRAGQLPIEQQLTHLRAALRRNRTLTEVLARAAGMDLPGVPCPPHRSTEAAIDTFEATAACLGVRRGPGGRWRIYALYGLADVFNLVVRPNPVLAPRHVYQAKAARWRQTSPSCPGRSRRPATVRPASAACRTVARRLP